MPEILIRKFLRNLNLWSHKLVKLLHQKDIEALFKLEKVSQIVKYQKENHTYIIVYKIHPLAMNYTLFCLMAHLM